mmetsp:Transcript_40481/g.114935  ORF Transcript_40481/g.114935 Transcript_40481/m.114935 type:complete len:522 (+) Transcript_40481:3-1568(+)
MIKAGFGMLIMVWSMWFLFYFEKTQSVEQARWGMDTLRNTEVQIPKTKRSPHALLSRTLGLFFTGMFICVFMVSCFLVNFWLSTNFKEAVNVGQTALIFVFSFMWGKIAKIIVRNERHRTQARFNRSMTLKLSMVKLWLYLFPLIKIAFLQPLLNRVCAATEDEAVELIFNNTENCGGIPDVFVEYPELFHKWAIDLLSIRQGGVADLFLEFLAGLRIVSSSKDRTCMKGCYPTQCELDELRVGDKVVKTSVVCLTSCFLTLQQTLDYIFVSHTIFMLVFLIIPIVTIRISVWKEIYKCDHEGEEPSILTWLTQCLSCREKSGSYEKYSLLQYQEKCHQEAPYEYESWGGSYVEDFLEVILCFAVLACFGIVCPWLTVFGLCAACGEYRLLAWRMTWVTARPFPQGSQGIGDWLQVIEFIIYVAIVMNSLLIVCSMQTYLDVWDARSKALFVFGWFMCLSMVKMLMKIVLARPPAFALRAADKNNEFTKKVYQKLASQKMGYTETGTSEEKKRILIGIGDD